jgi:hypothetical protein
MKKVFRKNENMHIILVADMDDMQVTYGWYLIPTLIFSNDTYPSSYDIYYTYMLDFVWLKFHLSICFGKTKEVKP